MSAEGAANTYGAEGEAASRRALPSSVATPHNMCPTPVGVIYGARRGVTLGPVPRTRITVHGDPSGPAYGSGRRFRRAQQRALRKGA